MSRLKELEAAVEAARIAEWIASCSTDRYIDLSPYHKDWQKAFDELKAYRATLTDGKE
jgi:hypothetical protein